MPPYRNEQKPIRGSRIVIVGNGGARANLSAQVDSADLVMRLGRCLGIDSGRVGTRTDIICVRTYGNVGEKFATGELIIDARAAAAAKECWFVGEVGNWAPVIIDRYHLHDRRHRHFSLAEMRRVDARLTLLGTAGSGSSLGTMAITFAVFDEEYENFDIETCGFQFTGWTEHPWRTEKRLFEEYCCRRLINSLEPRPYLDTVPCLAEQLSINREGRKYLVRNGDAEPLRIDEMALYILSKVDGVATVADICNEILEEFSQPPPEFELDVFRALWRFEDDSIVQWRTTDNAL